MYSSWKMAGFFVVVGRARLVCLCFMGYILNAPIWFLGMRVLCCFYLGLWAICRPYDSHFTSFVTVLVWFIFITQCFYLPRLWHLRSFALGFGYVIRYLSDWIGLGFDVSMFLYVIENCLLECVASRFVFTDGRLHWHKFDPLHLLYLWTAFM